MAKIKKKASSKPLLKDKDLDPKNISWNITIRVSQQILDEYKEWANELGVGYQTLMKIKMAEALRTRGLEDRVLELEQMVKKKRA